MGAIKWDTAYSTPLSLLPDRNFPKPTSFPPPHTVVMFAGLGLTLSEC